MLPRLRVHSIPAGKAPPRGADAVKVGYLMCSHGGSPARPSDDADVARRATCSLQ
jgi:hypothetical protein